MLRLLENPGVTAILGVIVATVLNLWAENRRWNREDRTRYYQDRMSLYTAYAKESAKVLAFTDWPETEKEQAQAKGHFEAMKDLYQEILLQAASTEVAQSAFDMHHAVYEALSWKPNYSHSMESAATARRAFIRATRKEVGLDVLEFRNRKDSEHLPTLPWWRGLGS